MATNPYEPPKEVGTPWTALIATTLGALLMVGTAQILINAWWNPPPTNEPQFLAAIVQVRAYFFAGIVWFVAGVFLFVGRWKTGWSLLLLGFILLLWSLPDR